MFFKTKLLKALISLKSAGTERSFEHIRTIRQSNCLQKYLFLQNYQKMTKQNRTQRQIAYLVKYWCQLSTLSNYLKFASKINFVDIAYLKQCDSYTVINKSMKSLLSPIGLVLVCLLFCQVAKSCSAGKRGCSPAKPTFHGPPNFRPPQFGPPFPVGPSPITRPIIQPFQPPVIYTPPITYQPSNIYRPSINYQPPVVNPQPQPPVHIQPSILNCSNITGAIGYNPAYGGCQCKQGFFWNGNQCFVNCSTIANTNGIPTNNVACGCKSGFYWTGERCAIACNQLPNTNQKPFFSGVYDRCNCADKYEWNGQSCSIRCPQFPFTNGGPAGDGICHCKDGFYWTKDGCVINCNRPNSSGRRTSASSCECNNGFVWNNNGACVINCKIQNSNGVATSQTSCQCNEDFVWQNGKCVFSGIDCSNVQNSNGQRASARTGCKCNDGYFWANNACIFRVDCSRIQNAQRQLQNNSCECIQGFFWDSNSRKCLIDCRNYRNSNGVRESDVSCQCINGYAWTNNACSRVINCQAIPNTRGWFINNTCQCNQGYIWKDNICAINCQQVQNTIGWGRTPGTCQCSQGYFWANNACVPGINCLYIDYALPNRNLDNTCNCIQGYIWERNICALDCRTYNNSNGLRESWTSCQCNEGFRWVGHKCVPKINCLGKQNSNGQLLVDNDGCQCNQGYIWLNNNCIPLYNCSKVENAIGQSRLSIFCTCNNGFYWEYGVCNINCTLPYSIGRRNRTSCLCQQGFYWETNSCLQIRLQLKVPQPIQQQKPIQIKYPIQPIQTTQQILRKQYPPQIQYNKLNTKCQYKFEWDPKLKICVINCLLVVNCNGKRLDFQTCQCHIGYIWRNNDCIRQKKVQEQPQQIPVNSPSNIQQYNKNYYKPTSSIQIRQNPYKGNYQTPKNIFHWNFPSLQRTSKTNYPQQLGNWNVGPIKGSYQVRNQQANKNNNWNSHASKNNNNLCVTCFTFDSKKKK